MKINPGISRVGIVAVTFLAAIALSGCGSPEPRPDNALVRAKTAVDQATTAGSRQYAAVDLNDAESKLQAANVAENRGHYKQARYLAEDSQVDAELASAKTQAGKAEDAANQLQRGNQALQDEVNRPNNLPSYSPPPSH